MGILEKVLITGASGYIGSNLIPVLEKEGHELHLTSRSKIGTDNRNVHLLDINNHKRLDQVVRNVKPNVVIHLAATGFQYDKKETLEELIRTNFLATSALVESCRKIPQFRRFIYLTTYMECQGSERPISPKDMLIPQSAYALSKSLSTNLLLHLSKVGSLDATVLRLFSVYGLNDLKFRFIPSLFDALMNDKMIETTSLKQKRDFIYIKDVADAILGTISTNELPHVIYNVGAGIPIPLIKVANKIKNLVPDSKGKIKIGAKPDRPNEAPCYFADISHTMNEIGWKPKYDIGKGLKETYGFYTGSLG